MVQKQLLTIAYALVGTNEHLHIKIGDYTIINREGEKLSVVTIDVNSNFNNQISDLSKKQSRKISILARVRSLCEFRQTDIINEWVFHLTFQLLRTNLDVS